MDLPEQPERPRPRRLGKHRPVAAAGFFRESCRGFAAVGGRRRWYSRRFGCPTQLDFPERPGRPERPERPERAGDCMAATNQPSFRPSTGWRLKCQRTDGKLRANARRAAEERHSPTKRISRLHVAETGCAPHHGPPRVLPPHPDCTIAAAVSFASCSHALAAGNAAVKVSTFSELSSNAGRSQATLLRPAGGFKCDRLRASHACRGV